MDHISVCICTYKRPKLLEELLSALESQSTGDRFTFSVVVVDNDHRASANPVVVRFKSKSFLEIDYCIEPVQNISLARNRAVKRARGNILAFVDDDEVPNADWLLQLYITMYEYGADGALGPVVPSFIVEPPKWILQGRLLDRPTHVTGTLLKHNDTRTGNLLIKASVFQNENAFDPRFGRTGGEDGEFFRRILKNGYIFVWAEKAIVHEPVPESRLTRKYFIKRAILRGITEAWISSNYLRDAINSSFAASIYIISLPVLFILGHHFFMKYLIKACDHIGKIMALIGIELQKERTF